ncbi:ATP-binding protein [Burkholderia stagnalis]|uniref:ATP-binding protein n=1 Tax=Burkholderia stagnalis TaxID=1503054 RepID=UPI0009BEABF2|nr:ATP-binding protein [Burkholderia stagnalis]MDY7806696.1 ATP-binding protein [Burkholderia stagnalis]
MKTLSAVPVETDTREAGASSRPAKRARRATQARGTDGAQPAALEPNQTDPSTHEALTQSLDDLTEPLIELAPWLRAIDMRLRRCLASQHQRGDDRFAMQGILGAVDEPYDRMNGGLPYWLVGETREPPLNFPETTGALKGLADRFGLSSVELGALVLSLMPLLEPRYGALIAYLQGEDQGSFPSVDLARQLLADTPADRIALRAALTSPEAPLRREGLIWSAERSGRVSERDDAIYLRPAESVFLYLTGQPSVLPRRLIDIGHWLSEMGPDPRRGAPAWARFAQRLADYCFGAQRPVTPVVLLQGGRGRESLIACMAREAGVRVLGLNLDMMPDDGGDTWAILLSALHLTRLTGSVLMLKELASLERHHARLLDALDARLTTHGQPVIALTSEDEVVRGLSGVPRLHLRIPVRSREADVALVEAGLRQAGHEADPIALKGLLTRTRVNPDVWAQTLQEADHYGRLEDATAPLSEANLHTALRLRAQQHFGALAQRVEPKRRLTDLIASDALLEQLDEILAAIRHREALLEQGFGDKIAYGTGISALFYGDSGTGKSMAAEVLAAELGVDLIRVDLSTVVNKYIGETEKNLSKIFDIAMADTGVLLFDEADALFGKRSEVKDAQDRHANIEVSYLLQRLEHYPGLVVLSTNNRGHLDDAFTRRLTFMTRFEPPDVALRVRMWRAIWPKHVALSDDIEWMRLAQNVELTGAGIRNVALLASWLAAERKREVRASDIERAIRRELGKTGRLAPRM